MPSARIFRRGPRHRVGLARRVLGVGPGPCPAGWGGGMPTRGLACLAWPVQNLDRGCMFLERWGAWSGSGFRRREPPPLPLPAPRGKRARLWRRASTVQAGKSSLARRPRRMTRKDKGFQTRTPSPGRRGGGWIQRADFLYFLRVLRAEGPDRGSRAERRTGRSRGWPGPKSEPGCPKLG
jgi:hypothetical protein